MRSILLDTNAYSNLLRGDQEVLAAIGRADEVLMSAIVLGELYQGFRGGSRYHENARLLQEFMADPIVCELSVSSETSELFGKIKQELKTAGTPIPINDVWIACQCLQSGATLVSNDRHFSVVPGLRLWNS